MALEAGSDKPLAPPSLPVVGDLLPDGWSLEAVEAGPDVLRFRLADGSGRRVVIALKDGPESAAKSPLAPLYYERTELQWNAFARAAGALRDRLTAAAPKEHGELFARLAHHFAPPPSPPEPPPPPPVVEIPQAPATDSRWVVSIDPARPQLASEDPPRAGLELDLLTPCPFPLEEARAALRRLARHRPPRILLPITPGAIEPRTIREMGLEEWPIEWRVDLSARGWDVGPVLQIIDAAIEVDARLELVVPFSADGFAVGPQLIPIVAALPLSSQHHVRICVEVPPNGPTIPFSSLRELPEAVRLHINRADGLRTHGMPLCLAPGALAGVLIEGRAAPVAEGGATYGSACDGCALREACPGLPLQYARRFGTGELRAFQRVPSTPERRWRDAEQLRDELPWDDKARWMLIDRPGASVELRGLVREPLPPLRCTMPWTHLEQKHSGFGPCCGEYMQVHSPCPPDAKPPELWKTDFLRTFRLALLHEEKPHTCRETCPVLEGGTSRLEDFHLQGGSAAAVENQIRIARAMINSEVDFDAAPTSVGIVLTSYCNYDCLMCDCGRLGTLDDQMKPDWYDSVRPWLDTLLVFEAYGGEPFASPHFRAFLEEMAASPRPPFVRVVTNGSYLTQKWLARWERLPFSSLTISLNAATAQTYAEVNRGLPWEGIRKNLDEILRLRREGKLQADIIYSTVILRRNIEELRQFAELTREDRVNVRYMLPMRDLNQQSIMTDRDFMERAATALEDICAQLETRRLPWHARDARAQLAVLKRRLKRGVLGPLGNVSLPVVAGPSLLGEIAPETRMATSADYPD